MKFFQILLLAVPVALSGCSDKPATEVSQTTDSTPLAPAADTAEASMRQLVEGMQQGQLIVAWNALPASYQKDVNELVQSFGNKMDPDAWAQVTSILKTVHKLLVDKHDFIVNHPAVGAGKDPAATAEGVQQIAGLLNTVVENASNLDALKTFDGAQFASVTGSKLVEQILALSKLAPGSEAGPASPFDGIQFETVTSTDSTATLKITRPDGQTETQEFVKHEGKWLPQDLVADWSGNMQQARDAVMKLPEQADKIKGQAMMMGGMVSGLLSPLQSAETQEQFNAAAGNLMASAGMFMGGSMSGPPPAIPASEPAPADGSLSDSLDKPAAPAPETPPAPEK